MGIALLLLLSWWHGRTNSVEHAVAACRWTSCVEQVLMPTLCLQIMLAPIISYFSSQWPFWKSPPLSMFMASHLVQLPKSSDGSNLN
jgi:hypothetical protein